MAKPIKETPILRGKDAKRFCERLSNVEKQKMPQSEYEKLMANYNKIQKQADF
ncbi:MAG: hypothetical protein L3V56_03170 [Candidatus Magnetoovum sp. WYHC-5]|nr:hypothetical protein [Candidatus Magnetoovum sp. WYHC-5]